MSIGKCWVVGFLMFILPISALIEKELLITGCARSGTTYISNVFHAVGIDLSHDHDGDYVGNYGISSWLLVPDVEKAPWGPLRKDYHFHHIFHQVRHPLKVISSVHTTEVPLSWQYILENIPEIAWSDSHTVKAAKYWYYWNLRAEQIAEWTYRIEEIEEIWPEFAKRLNISLPPVVPTWIPKDTNTRGALNRNFTWRELQEELPPELYGNIRSLAEKYGYSLESEELETGEISR